MSFTQWKKSSANYSSKLLHSGLEGAHSGGDAFLGGRPLSPFLNETARHAAAAAAIGVGIGLLGAFSANRHRSARAGGRVQDSRSTVTPPWGEGLICG